MSPKADQFLEQLKRAIASEQLVLPSLPDIALRVRDECEKPDSSVDSIAEVIAQDPALSARLLQVANSSLFLSHATSDNLTMAVTRLGLNLVKDLIMGLAMKQLYQASTDVLEERFRELWLASVKTAAISRMLAVDHKQLNPEQAMVAGLIHNIGALPILLLAEEDDELFYDSEALYSIILELQGTVGAHIFKAWHFPEYMLEIANHCYDFNRSHPGEADYVDLIQVALIEASIYTGLDVPDNWSRVPAFEKLGINTETNILEIEENKLVFEETESLFK